MLKTLFSTAVLLAGLCHQTHADDLRQRPKNIGIFNVVKFPNEPCDSTDTKNGTCYTEAECDSKGGKAAGSCADGYGVCCVFTQGCGDTASENGTYWESAAGVKGQCNLRVCKCQSDICQLRLDFMTMVIAGPSTVTDSIGFALAGRPLPSSEATAIALGTAVSSVTQCKDDQFSVTSPGAPAPPVICGTNTGMHMYVDASEACNTLSFQLSATSTVTRSWTIKVSQISCSDKNLPPSGCTQYFWGSSTGTLESFNRANKVHLAEQNQNICIRREKNMCAICYATAADDFRISGMTANAVVAGCGMLGQDANAAKVSEVDRVIIPAPATKANLAALDMNDDAFCGGTLGTAAGATAATVCSKQTPFSIRFVSDAIEYLNEANQDTANVNFNHEGFKIDFTQRSC